MRRGIQEKYQLGEQDSEEQYHSASYYKYLIHYHIIRYLKFMFLVLKDYVEEILKQILQKNLLSH